MVQSALHSQKAKPGSGAPWFAVHWTTPLHDLNKFNNGAMAGMWNSAPRWSFPAGLALFTLPLLAALALSIARRRDPAAETSIESVKILVLLWIVPHAILLALAALGMQYELRYALFSLVPYYILTALGISLVPSVPLRSALITLVLLYSLCGLRSVYFLPDNDDYRGAFEYLVSRAGPSACYASSPAGILPVQWSFYQPRHSLPRGIDLETPGASLAGCKELWIFREFRLGLPSPAALSRVESDYSPVRTAHFVRIHVTLYQPK